MSMSECQKTRSRDIPTRRVIIHDAALLPQDYSITPGGTLYSTTPGGTRLIYDRKFLMECRNSPLTRTPPHDLPNIPGVTTPNTDEAKTEANHVEKQEEKSCVGEESQFEMDM